MILNRSVGATSSLVLLFFVYPFRTQKAGVTAAATFIVRNHHCRLPPSSAFKGSSSTCTHHLKFLSPLVATGRRMASSSTDSPNHPQRPRPNDSTYWVNDMLLAGEHPTSKKCSESQTRKRLRDYLECGITCFVDLTFEGERADYEQILMEEAANQQHQQQPGTASPLSRPVVSYKRLPIPDFGIPESKERMKEILNTIDMAINEGGSKAYVHCRGGIGRTGTVVGCYIMRHRDDFNNNVSSGKDALDEVNRLFQASARSSESYYSPETRDQMRFVEEWEE